jgi:hypothetical protein
MNNQCQVLRRHFATMAWHFFNLLLFVRVAVLPRVLYCFPFKSLIYFYFMLWQFCHTVFKNMIALVPHDDEFLRLAHQTCARRITLPAYSVRRPSYSLRRRKKALPRM